jgi:hypothetical protein
MRLQCRPCARRYCARKRSIICMNRLQGMRHAIVGAHDRAREERPREMSPEWGTLRVVDMNGSLEAQLVARIDVT